MNAVTRRKLDMGDRALNFSIAHPDASPGYAAALAGLQQRLSRSQQLAQIQQDGINQRKAANARKHQLRRQMRKTQLKHLARVAKVAGRDTTELNGKLVLSGAPRPYRSFRAVAGTMIAESQTWKELLVKYGLADTVLDSLVLSLEQFDRAIADSTDALRAHVSARAELEVLGDEVVDIVGVMDALNRFRFADDLAALAEWDTVSNVITPVHTSDEPEVPPTPNGEVKPAA
jgi:hypothetical protein